MPTALAFLQARMGSQRLPGKVLLRIGGKSILERAILRLQATETVNKVVVVTTRLPEDDQIEEEAKRVQAEVYRGPETDVLARYREASDLLCPEIIVRATADNPLIDVGSVDRIVRALSCSDLDFCMESGLPVGAATEAITRRALEKVDRLTRDPRDREHVTVFVKEHPERFRLAYLSPPDRLKKPHLRLTIDTPEDFIFMETLMDSLPESSSPAPTEMYLDVASILPRERV